MRSFMLIARYRILMASMLLAAMVYMGLTPTRTEAAIAGCRADPIVILSDGTILDVSVDIGTNVANVKEIHYTIHGPRNVSLIAAISTPTLGFAGRETFTYYNDARPGEYTTETIVQTSYNKVNVTAYTSFLNSSIGNNTSLSVQYRPIRGFNNEILRVLLSRAG